jgi:hypothetical protein
MTRSRTLMSSHLVQFGGCHLPGARPAVRRARPQVARPVPSVIRLRAGAAPFPAASPGLVDAAGTEVAGLAARYHADLARRRYLAVDPANRLVADVIVNQDQRYHHCVPGSPRTSGIWWFLVSAAWRAVFHLFSSRSDFG